MERIERLQQDLKNAACMLSDDHTRIRDDAAAERIRWLSSHLPSLIRDAERLDWLGNRVLDREHQELNYTKAWVEHGDYGSVLSSGPSEFWLEDDGTECGPTLRAAIDAARAAALPSQETRTDE
jgi:hypothetical protein